MKTVAIVGSHSGTRELAPFGDKSVDIWVLNEAAQARWCKRASAVFQMHLPAIYQSPNNVNNSKHWGWLQQRRGYPVYMQAVDPLVPDSVEYPLDDICKALLPFFTIHDARVRFFTSTTAYCMALAIYKRYERILVYGVELATETEYFTQQAGFAFWTGVAVGQRITVEMHSGDGIFARPLYGYDGSLDYDPQQFADRYSLLHAQVEQLKANLPRLDISPEGMQAFPAYSMAQQALAYTEGRANEALRYHEKTSAMIAKHGRAILDRSEFEIVCGKASKIIADYGEASTRALGWIDYSAAAYHQSGKNPVAEIQLRDAIASHIKARREYGYHLGVHDENREMIARYDELSRAAGGSKSVAILREEIT